MINLTKLNFRPKRNPFVRHTFFRESYRLKLAIIRAKIGGKLTFSPDEREAFYGNLCHYRDKSNQVLILAFGLQAFLALMILSPTDTINFSGVNLPALVGREAAFLALGGISIIALDIDVRIEWYKAYFAVQYLNGNERQLELLARHPRAFEAGEFMTLLRYEGGFTFPARETTMLYAVFGLSLLLLLIVFSVVSAAVIFATFHDIWERPTFGQLWSKGLAISAVCMLVVSWLGIVPRWVPLRWKHYGLSGLLQKIGERDKQKASLLHKRIAEVRLRRKREL